MSRKDQLTNKGPLSGNSRSHAMNHSRRVWNLNLQTANMRTDNGQVIRVKVSAKTKKTLKKQNRLA